MKTLSRKIMAFAFMLLSVTISAFADTWRDPSTGITWTYTVLDDGTVALGGGGTSTSNAVKAVPMSTTGELVVPAQINGLDVTSIMPWAFYNCWHITSFVFESANMILQPMADHIFYKCSGLTEVGFASNWDTSNVTDMSYMFGDCTRLVDISGLANWDVSKVKSISNIFNLSKITNLAALANWNTVNLTNMGGAFVNCSEITDITPLANWNVGKVTNMGNTFDGCSGITDITPLANWNTGNVRSLASFLRYTKISSIAALANWNVSKVTNMTCTFMGTRITDLTPLTNWNTVNLTNMGGTFSSCTGITDISPLANWNVGKVTTLYGSYWGTFQKCTGITDISPLANWNTANVTNMSNVFYGCTGITDISPLANWNTANVTNMSNVFYGCTGITNISPLANWNTANVTTIAYTFENCTRLVDISGLTNWNTAKVTNMAGTFLGCTGITDLSPLANWDVSKVTNMGNPAGTLGGGMFEKCTSITDLTPLANWNTGNVIYMSALFNGCTSIADITPLANWNTGNVKEMRYLFDDCDNLQSLDPLSSWNTSNVNNMQGMFMNCNDGTYANDFYNWNIDNVTNLSLMFAFSGLKYINMSDWNVSGKDMKFMFTNIKEENLNMAYSLFNLDNVSQLQRVYLPKQSLEEIAVGMFDGCTALTEITIPSTVKQIDAYAFKDCSSLKEITIPSKVNAIEGKAFWGCDNLTEVYCMASNPPDLDSEAFGASTGTINKTLYVKPSALEAYKAHEEWSRFATITDIIPIVIGTGKNYATFSFDFDADFSETEGIQPYIASKYLEGEEAVEYLNGFEAKKRLVPGLHKAASSVNQDVKLIVLARYPNGYVPSRTGEDNFDFHGVILYGQPGTYYFKMGEQDYASDNQKTVTWNTNYMRSCYESWLLNPIFDHTPKNWMEYPKSDTYNFVLKSNKFKYIDNAGTINRHKSWLELPAEKVSGTYFEAGAKMISLFDPDDSDSFATGLSFVVEDEPSEIQSRYNLNGQKVDTNYKGVVIVNGRKIYNQ